MEEAEAYAKDEGKRVSLSVLSSLLYSSAVSSFSTVSLFVFAFTTLPLFLLVSRSPLLPHSSSFF